MATTSSCPGCGAPLPFRPGTMVAVCRFCKSLSARTDRDPALVGKVAALVDSESPLKVGLRGEYAGKGYEVTGRVQLSHPLGGTWDEWYLAFDDGRWGWLATAQGKVYLTFETPLTALPANPSNLQAGETLDLGPQGRWVVGERSEAAFAGAEGEIPWAVEPGGTYPYLDLAGPHGAFATLDFGDDVPAFYLGREQSWEDLGLGAAPAVGRKVKALGLNCPHCSSPLSLRAPDQTLRVGCPSCGSLLACDQGKLTYLTSLQQPGGWQVLELGSEGRLRGVPYTCIGALRRACTVEGVAYPWSEYLLMDARGGFRWLTESDGHWSFVEPVGVGEVQATGVTGMGVAYQGGSFRKYQEVNAQVLAVFGEFYWKVSQGERAEVAEFVAAPRSLSKETQGHGSKGQEVTWSLSTYLQPDEVAQAFKLAAPLPAPSGIAPHMPNPHRPLLGRLVPWMAAALAAWALALIVASVRHREELVFRESINLVQRFPSLFLPKRPGQPPPPDTPGASLEAGEPVLFLGPIQIKDGRKNLGFSLSAPVDNQWLGVEGALVNEQTGDVELFEATASYYHGVDEGESWREGRQTERVLLSALPAGTYLLRLAPAWEGPRPPVTAFNVELRSGVLHWAYFGWTLAIILLWPLIQFFRVMAFEGRRWSDSMYSTSHSSGGDD